VWITTGPPNTQTDGTVTWEDMGGTFSQNVYDVNAATGCNDILLQNVGVDFGAGSYSLPSTGVATVIGGTGGRSSVQAAYFGVPAGGGPSGLTSAARFVGSIAAGPPTAATSGSAVGASLAGDFVVDQTGSIWVCYGAGTPGSWAELATSASYALSQDPLKLGQAQTFLPGAAPAAYSTVMANTGWYMRLLSGGYSIGHIAAAIGTSSGNISVAAYQASGTGASAVPATQLQTSGSVACPAAGTTAVALGGSCTPNVNDWLALGCDNGTATAACTVFSYTSNTALAQGGSYTETGLTGAVLPAPAGTLAASAARMFFLRGTA
jgi:hypothetical protein